MFEKNSIDAVNKYRFKPARRISDDVVVPVVLTIDITYRLHGRKPLSPVGPARYELSAPPGALSGQPDAEGVYPFTPQLDAPEIVDLKAKVFTEAAYALSGRVECRVLLVLDAKGKPQTADTETCDHPQSFLRGAAVQSVMKSKYKPARLNGQAVPVRMTVHLIYDRVDGTNGTATQ
jgi:hypothetical protein